jgi:hypothetical protein
MTRSMQPQSSVLMMPTNKPTGKPISMPLVATTIKSTGKPAHVPGIKPTTLPADSTKGERLCNRQATQLRNASTPTSPTPRIKTRAQVATAAAQVAPHSLNTRSRTQQLGMPPPTRRPGSVAEIMRKQWHQCGLMRLTCHIT